MYVVPVSSQNLHDESSSGIVGISLVGRQAGLSPSGPPNDPPFPAALPRREKEDAEVSAEEMDQRINQHLQTQTLQWLACGHTYVCTSCMYVHIMLEVAK